MKKAKLNISVFDYDDYRQFLKDAYNDMRSQEPNYSYRFLQKKAGYSKTSNHFWQVISGNAPLSERAARRFGKAFGLDTRGTQFLVLLAGMAQAKTDEDRNHFVQQLKTFAGFRKRMAGGRIQYDYYSEWYLPALRELVNLDDFREDPDWMAKRLNPHITQMQARDGLKQLLDLGYLKRDPSGRLRQTEPLLGNIEDLKIPDPLSRLAFCNFHRHMIKLGSESIERIPQNKRFISGITMSVSLKQSEAIRDLAQEYLKRVESIVLEDEPVETVCRLNLQFFPIVVEPKQQKPRKNRRSATRKKFTEKESS